jgi:ParB/RepB/Spo0J family partition protein
MNRRLEGSAVLGSFGGTNARRRRVDVQPSTINRIEDATSAIKMVAIDEIAVPSDRLRALRPDYVKHLADSISLRGLLHPIRVQSNPPGPYQLVIGRHRLEAAKLLGWTAIDAVVVEDMDADEALLAEIDENLIRTELSPAERALHHVERKRLYEKLHPETKHGAIGRGRGKSSQNEKSFVNGTAVKTGKGRSTVAREVTRANKVVVLTDIIGTSLDRGTEIDALGELSESEQHRLAERAKAGEKVSAKTRVKQVKRAEREQAVAAKQLALPDKKYNVIVCDDEWDFEVWSRETGLDRHASNYYPTVADAHTAEEMHARTKERFACAADDCVLFMWTTVPHLAIAIDLLRLRGFRYVTNFDWGKDKAGTGYWNRNKHEHLLVGVKGHMPCPAPGEQWDSLIMAPVTEHSAKPQVFLELVQAYFPTMPKIELNRRGPPQPGWDAWGNEVEPRNEAAMPAAVMLESTPESTQAATNTDGLDLPGFLQRY